MEVLPFNSLFAIASPLFNTVDDHLGFPALKEPRLEQFLVKNIFTDFKRHDLGPGFYERDFDGTTRRELLMTPLPVRLNFGLSTRRPNSHVFRSTEGRFVQAMLREWSALSCDCG